MTRWTLVPLALALALRPGHAQAVVARDTTMSSAAGADSVVSVTRAPVILDSPPNTLHVVKIEIPDAFQGRELTYTFVRQNTFGVLGRLEGTIGAADHRALGISISIPPTAAAGRTVVGVMRFACAPGCETIEVPVVVNVLANYALRVSATRSLIGSHSGARVHSDVTVHNDGNATEQVFVALEVPNDWRSRLLSPQPTEIAAGASATVEFEILIGESASEGDYGAVVRATAASGATAFTSLSVRVEAGQRGVVGWRPSLETNAAFANDVRGNTAAGFGAELTGEVMPDMRANGRVSILRANAASGLAVQSLGRLGYATGNSYLFLTTPRWETGIGDLGLSDGGLAGMGAWGTGATASVTNDAWRLRTLAVRPVSGADGHYLYANASRRVGALWLGGLASDMRDQTGVNRDARTAAGTVTIPWHNGSAEIEGGYRSGAQAAGLAWLTRVEHRTNDWAVNLRAARAPGGTAAFARAEHELQLDGTRKLGRRLSVGTSYWQNSDSNRTVLQGARTSGGSVTGQMRFGSAGDFSLASRSSELNQTTTLGSFSTAERGVEASWVRPFAHVNARVGASHGSVDRVTDFGGGLRSSVDAVQTMFFGTLSGSTPHGDWQLDARHELTGAGVGIPTSQSTVSVHADRIPVLSGRATIHGEALVYYLAATRSSLSSQKIGAQFRVGDNYALLVDADHNQFFGTGAVASPWAITMRIQRAIGLPPLRGVAPRGLVFADVNGDGVRQANEHGVAGVVVRVDGNLVTTDGQGRFVTARGRVLSVDIDPRSLPSGWIVAPRLESPTLAENKVELAVIPTSPVEITVRLGETQGVDTANVRINQAVVILTDSLGRSWTGQPDGRGVFRLDALPPGLYEISADLSKVGEMLVLPQPLPTIRVTGGSASVKAELKLSPRPIRRADPARIPPIRKVGGGTGGGSAVGIDGK